MKLRNFKKSIHSKKDYKYHEPRINQKMFIRVSPQFVEHYCHRLESRKDLGISKTVYIITKKRKRHEQDHSPKAE